ncbi:MAG: dITP/XTP pyrophosphatase [Deltaproteobacteria bacterium ADurb.Bin207]|jgi:XTP/dITP diphosphohydrolase|nr:MAG: dITP/XTP pyrophosphatase [Deltaproteobacteria bacterium ADurb.Bin207]
MQKEKWRYCLAAVAPNDDAMNHPLRLVIATKNPDKVAEFESLLAGLDLDLVTAQACGVPDVEETGETLAENAALKAEASFRATGEISLADDTGLCVRALGGEPGVRSARFAGPGASYEQNRNLLLEKMRGLPMSERDAIFVTCLAIVVPSRFADNVSTRRQILRDNGQTGSLHWVEGRAKGQILEAPTGSGTFGYDPIFYVPDLGKTFAELSREEKNAVSHRGRAYRALREHLKSVLQRV